MNIIGKGAFGEVFKGKLRQNKSTEITVAIKVALLKVKKQTLICTRLKAWPFRN